MFDYQALINEIELHENTNKPLQIALFGAGGKTSAMYALGKHFAALGLRVILTTTTKVVVPSGEQADNIIINESLIETIENQQTTFIGRKLLAENKVAGFAADAIQSWPKSAYDILIYEADGAKRKAIKAPREDEPILVPSTDVSIGVVGLDVLGEPSNEEIVHRFAYYKKITGVKLNEPIRPEHIKMLVLHPQGLFKGVEAPSKKILLLTKMDTTKRKKYAHEIKVQLKEWDGVVIAI